MNNSLHFARKYMFGCLSADIICSEKRTVSFEEREMPHDKYASKIFVPNKSYCVIILQIFFATREVLKIGECHSDIPQSVAGEYSVT